MLVANALAFSEGSITGARLALFCILAFAASFGLVIPISRLSRRRAVRKAEEMFPAVPAAPRHLHRKEGDDDPFLELLAADALDVASGVEPAALAPNARLLALLGVGVASVGVLLWMIVPGQDSSATAPTCSGPARLAAPRLSTIFRSARAMRPSAATPTSSSPLSPWAF